MIASNNNSVVVEKNGSEKPKRLVSPIVVKDAAVASFAAHEFISNVYDDRNQDDVTKFRSTSLKKVSFGAIPGTNVETFVYENIPDGHLIRHRYTSPPPQSSPTRVTVELVDTQLPCSIEPPSEIGLVFPDGTVTAASTLLANYSKPVHVVSTTVVPPEIPSRKRMDDHENPFRPEGLLRNEVDPIVEGFKTKPFHPPLSDAPLMCDTIVAAADGELRASSISPQQPQCITLSITNDNLVQETHRMSSAADNSPAKSKDLADCSNQNVNKSRHPVPSPRRRSSGGGSTPKNAAAMVSTLLTTNNGSSSSQKGGSAADVEHKILVSPRLGQVEVVHLDDDDAKKKRCSACCSVQ